MELQEIKQLGTKIREHRKSLDLTLPELAQKTGLSASYLSRVERGKSSPSLRSLALLARTFGQSIAKFFESKTKSQAYPDKNGLKSEGISINLFAEFLTGNPKVKIALCALEPKTGFPNKHTHQGEEVIYVLDGQAEVELGNEKSILTKGESYGFQGNTLHNIWNPTNYLTRLMIARISKEHNLIKRD